MSRSELIEVLSPAGSFESLKAALKAGADAVYIGGAKFGARAYAQNLQEEEMMRAIDYAHLHDKQLYMTINTLFKPQEFEELYDYLYPYYREGLDAVIVQDMGVAQLIRDEFPKLDLHASTQMTVMGVEGARFLEELGFTRVVPARELSLEEIAEIRRETNLEIETFVHGALCFSYSGQCLMSSMLGGRSGNRGRCAQPCRLPYDLYENKKKINRKNERYLLSPKDLCSLEILPDILKAGTNSLKIEGRMKRPEYVAAVTRQYRGYVDQYLRQECKKNKQINYHVRKQDLQELKDLYNRGGFTKGYYLTHNGRDMMSMERPNHKGVYVGKIEKIRKNQILFVCQTDIHKQDILEISLGNEQKVELTSPINAKKGQRVCLNANQIRKLRLGMEIYRTKNAKLLQSIKQDILDIEKKENLKGIVTFCVGKPVMMQLSKENLTISVEGDIVQKAQKQPMTKEKLKEQMTKTGGTPFFIEVEQIHMDKDGFLPVGALKKLRRNALEHMEEEIICQKRRNIIAHNAKKQMPVSVPVDRKQTIVSATTMEQAKTALEIEMVDAIYLLADAIPFEEWETFTKQCHLANKEIYYVMPYVFHKKAKDDWKIHQDLICHGSHQGIVIKTIDEFALIRNFSDFNKIMVLDSSLYAYHPQSADFYRSYAGHQTRMILPVELNEKELNLLQQPNADMVVYGHQPLMISAQCQVKNHLQCEQKPKNLCLKDRYQKEFPVQNFCQYCYNVIYNGEILNLTNMDAQLEKLKLGGRIYRFTVENREQMKAVFQGSFNKKNYTKGHFKRGME